MQKERKDRLAMTRKQIIDLSRISGALAGLAFGLENQNIASFIMDLHNGIGYGNQRDLGRGE